jgi:hypothetical protein
LKFLETVIEQMPFPIQRIQTDRGNEFFAYSFQKRSFLMLKLCLATLSNKNAWLRQAINGFAVREVFEPILVNRSFLYG